MVPAGVAYDNIAWSAANRQGSQDDGAISAQPRLTYTTENYRVVSSKILGKLVLTSI
jgi:hypothetical protein